MSSAVDHGDDPLAEAVVGLADDDGVADTRVGLEGGLDGGDRDVLAAPDDDVLEAAGDGDPAVVVDRGPVAGVEPAVGEGGLGGLGVVVADAQLGAADQELVVLAEAELDRTRRPAVVVAAPLGRVAAWAVATVGASVDP